MLKYLLYVAAGTYLISLALPGITLEDGTANVYGYTFLLTGWVGAAAGIIPWYANPLAIISWFMAVGKKYKTSFALALVAFLIGLQTLTLNPFPATYGGGLIPVTFFGPGFLIWELSFALLALYAFIKYRQVTKQGD